MIHLNKLPLVLIFLFLLACKKDEMKLLPDATQNGADTMGAIVNGKAWVANGGTGFKAPEPVEAGYLGARPNDETRNNFIIEAYRKDGTGFQFYLRNVSQPGEYFLNSSTVLFGDLQRQPQNYGAYFVPSKLYMTSSRYTGSVNITRADTVKGVVSGTFSFKAVNGSDSVAIYNGRFDASTFK